MTELTVIDVGIGQYEIGLFFPSMACEAFPNLYSLVMSNSASVVQNPSGDLLPRDLAQGALSAQPSLLKSHPFHPPSYLTSFPS